MPKSRVTELELRRRQVDVIGFFCNKRPPLSLIGNLDRSDDLQSWIGVNLKSEFQYATSIAVMEAAEMVARSAIENGEEIHEDEADY